MQHGLNTFFISHSCRHTCARKIDDVEPTMQSSCGLTRRAHDSLQMHTCTSRMHTPTLDYARMQMFSQRQRNKLYKHVYLIRCNLPCSTRCKSCEKIFTVKSKQAEGVALHRPSSVILGNVRNPCRYSKCIVHRKLTT